MGVALLPIWFWLTNFFWNSARTWPKPTIPPVRIVGSGREYSTLYSKNEPGHCRNFSHASEPKSLAERTQSFKTSICLQSGTRDAARSRIRKLANFDWSELVANRAPFPEGTWSEVANLLRSSSMGVVSNTWHNHRDRRKVGICEYVFRVRELQHYSWRWSCAERRWIFFSIHFSSLKLTWFWPVGGSVHSCRTGCRVEAAFKKNFPRASRAGILHYIYKVVSNLTRAQNVANLKCYLSQKIRAVGICQPGNTWVENCSK